MEKEKKKLNLKIIIPIVIAIVVIIAIIIILSLKTKIFWNYFDYIDNGEFEIAFEKAKNEEERNSVIKANAIAYVTLSAVTSGDYKDKDLVKYEDYCTCTINEAWYDKDKNIVICLRSITTSTNYYLYFAYSESKKDYDFVCISKDPITIDNITLADNYTKGVKNSGYGKPIQKIAIDTMKKKLPEKLAEIMTKENRVVRETNITDYLLTNFVKLDKDIELLKVNK